MTKRDVTTQKVEEANAGRKTETVRARVHPALKHEAENILKELGLNPTEAITIFFQQIKLHRGLPFEIKLPNSVTLQTFEDTDAGRELETYESLQDAFDDLDSLCEKPSSRPASKKTMPVATSKAKTSRSSKRS